MWRWSFLIVLTLLFCGMASGAGTPILAPGDPIIAIDADGNSADQPNELVEEVIDGILGGANMKYLNPGGANSGFIVTPSLGASLASSIGFWTANDTPGRDPATWALYGTNDPITSAEHSNGTAENWTQIATGSVTLPDERNTQTPTTVEFTNNTLYKSYKLLFPTLKSAEPLMQIAEIQFYGPIYTAYSPKPENGSLYSNNYASLQWTPGETAASHDVYFGTNYDNVLNGTGGTSMGNITNKYFVVGFDPYPYPEGLVAGVTYYWRIDEVEADGVTRYEGNVWSFKVPPNKAYAPIPADGARFVDPENPLLTWTPGYGAMLHTIYFSDDYDTVANGAPGGGDFLPDASYSPDPLEPGKTYYWRVDEDNPNTHKQYQGDVWSFTAATPGGGLRGDYYHGMNFEIYILSRIDEQINFSWGDFGPDPNMNVDAFTVRWVGEIEIPFDETYTFTTTSDDGIRLWIDGQLVVDSWIDQGTTDHSGDIDLTPGKYSIQVEYYENGGGAVAQLSWESPSTPREYVPQAALSPPVRASGPFPANAAVDARTRDLSLTWYAGQYAVSHDVYFGTDQAAVTNATNASPEFKGAQGVGNEIYVPAPGGELAWGTTYYWRVDEVNNLSADSPWTGNVWSFTTANFMTVEDFEDYNDEPPDRVFETWIDGFGGNTNGSIAGYPYPVFADGEHFCETSIVNGGLQSMPFFYDNNLKYSEVTRTLPADLRDWTQHDVKALNLWYYGYIQSQKSFVEGPVGTYTMTGAGADIWGAEDQFHYAWKTLGAGAASITAKISAPTGTNMIDWVKVGLMIRETLDPNSINAFMGITNTQGAVAQWRLDTGGDTANAQLPAVTERPQWIRLTKDLAGNYVAYHANDVGNAPGTWAQVGTIDIQMDTPAFIGLAVTSHQAGVPVTAVFSNITTTGAVTGATWTNQDIGIQSNAPERMYVMIRDSAGQMATVYNPDLDAANVTAWTAWGQYGQGIALSEFTAANPSLNLANIDSISLGFGTRGNTTQPGGSGLMFIDDIGLYTSRCVYQLGKPDNDYSNNCVVDYPDLELLTDNWLVSDYEVTPTAPGNDGLLAYYKFENNLLDSSGNARHGTTTGTSAYAAGQTGNALDVGGTADDVIDIGLQPSELGISGNTPKTVTAWVYTRSFNDGGIFDMGANVNSQNFSLRTMGTENLWRAQRYGYPTYDFDVTYPSSNVWVHMALVYEGEAGGHASYVYADGKRIGMQVAELNTTDNRTFQIGVWSGNYFDGLIDELRLYNRALTQAEVASLAGETTPFTQPIERLLTPQDANMDTNSDGTIDFKDYAGLIDTWLDEQLWP